MSVSLSDEQVEEMVALYRAIARMFINKYQEEKIAKSQD
jgi:L-2-hydroxyglutarate oxidase LhgO